LRGDGRETIRGRKGRGRGGEGMREGKKKEKVRKAEGTGGEE